jgi:predicted NUDIX family phosphoesterase
MKKETIMCIETKKINEFFNPLINKKFIPKKEVDNIDNLLNEFNVYFCPREEIENNLNFKQLIPYIILRIDNKIVGYTRTKKAGEERLHNQVSIGLGGHINLSDIVLDGENLNVKETIQRNMFREIQEELKNDIWVNRKSFKGFILDNSSEVSSVHIGLLEIWDIDWDIELNDLKTDDKGLSNIKTYSLQELIEIKDQLESWSSIALFERLLKD